MRFRHYLLLILAAAGTGAGLILLWRHTEPRYAIAPHSGASTATVYRVDTHTGRIDVFTFTAGRLDTRLISAGAPTNRATDFSAFSDAQLLQIAREIAEQPPKN